MFESMRSNRRRKARLAKRAERKRDRALRNKHKKRLRTPDNYTADRMDQDHRNSMMHYEQTVKVERVSVDEQKAEAEAYLREQDEKRESANND